MNQRRIFKLLAIIGLVAAVFMLIKDTRSGDINCGSALLPTDLSELSLDSGDAEADNFAVEVYRSDCSQNVTRQRFIVALILLGSAGAYSASKTIEKRRHISGDPIV